MERDLNTNDTYIKKLSTLLPAEITGLYLFIRSLSQGDIEFLGYLACAVVVIAILFYVLAPQIIHISQPATRLLYCATFLLWVASIDVFTISDYFELPRLTFIIPATVAIWSFALPYVFDRLAGAK